VRARRLSAGVIPVRPRRGGHEYLLLRAFANWDFPKGLVRDGEDPLDAAVRELAEETDLRNPRFRWGEAFRETAPYARGKVARYYLAECGQGEVRLLPGPELGRPEHHEFRWLEYRAARSLLPPRLEPILDWAEALVSPLGDGC